MKAVILLSLQFNISNKSEINERKAKSCAKKFRTFALQKEKRRFTHGETACCYQRNGLSLRDRQGDDTRRHIRNPGRENQSLN